MDILTKYLYFISQQQTHAIEFRMSECENRRLKALKQV